MNENEWQKNVRVCVCLHFAFTKMIDDVLCTVNTHKWRIRLTVLSVAVSLFLCFILLRALC